MAVPLIFEIVFLAWLGVLLFQAEQQASSLSQSRDIASEVSNLSKCFLDTGIAIGAWKSTHGSEFVRRYDLAVAKMPLIYQRLDQLSAGNPARQEHVKKLRRYADQILHLTGSVRRPSDAGTVELADPIAFREELSAAYDGFSQETQALMQEEQQIQAANPAEEVRLRQRLEFALAVGILANIIVSVALARFFGTRIVERIEILIDNSARLVKKQALHPLVHGDDEIAELDQRFHDMADLLSRAERRKQEYIQMINHDLRTPLTAIQGTLAVAARGTYGPLNEKGQKRMNDAEEDADRLISLINEMLDIERLESGKFDLDKELVSAAEIVTQSFDTVRPLADSRGVTLATAGGEGTVFADKERLVRVMVNLLGNAIKFSSTGQSVTVNYADDDKGLNVRVADQGRGIPSIAMPYIFDRFRQVEQADAKEKGGTGLGLAICKAIIEAHGGQIGAYSTEGKGSTFWFTIPHQPFL